MKKVRLMTAIALAVVVVPMTTGTSGAETATSFGPPYKNTVVFTNGTEPRTCTADSSGRFIGDVTWAPGQALATCSAGATLDIRIPRGPAIIRANFRVDAAHGVGEWEGMYQRGPLLCFTLEHEGGLLIGCEEVIGVNGNVLSPRQVTAAFSVERGSYVLGAYVLVVAENSPSPNAAATLDATLVGVAIERQPR